ncbi:MAG: cytochrome c biogenesis protein CcmE [Trueperaceae bacterium]|nr:cytochrome c biogenesis protein CcmE [Trueperaceae bacterium]MCH2667330.1 cytochrome c maturation protein CcmE [Deinococcales bacterium]
MKRTAYYLIAAVILVSAGLMIYRVLNESLVYFVLPNEYAQRPSEYADRRIRLAGIVEKGSASFDSSNLQLIFVVSDGIESYEVNHTGSPPDMFKENGGVVIEGSFQNGVFMSDNLLVKHTEVYQAPDDGQPIDVEALKDSLN